MSDLKQLSLELKSLLSQDELPPQLNDLAALVPLILFSALDTEVEPALAQAWREGFSDFEPIDFKRLFDPLSETTVAAAVSGLSFWDSELDKPNRKLALELADMLGVDRAQQLYKFAVLVTKLA